MKKKLKKLFILWGTLIPVFAVGLLLGLNSWDKNLYVRHSLSDGRGLASDSDSPTEVLSLSYKDLSQKASQVLFSQNKVQKEGELLSFYLADLLLTDPQTGHTRFICQIFPLVEFSFSADLSLSGEESLMIIQSPCNSEEEGFIGPFWIPVGDIMAYPSKQSFELEREETYIRFYNASTTLTESWFLKNVRFFSEDQEDEDFLVRSAGPDNPYFELALKEKQPPSSPPQPVIFFE